MYDIAPPENDDEAVNLGNAIRQWIKQGRPKPGTEKKTYESDLSQKEETDTEHKQDKEEAKSKKKRGVFGFFKK